MASVREQVLTNIISTLTDAGITGVWRSRQEAFRRDEGLNTVIEPVDEEVENLFDGRVERTLRVVARSIVRSGTPDTDLDARHVAIVKAVNANPTINGLAVFVKELGSVWRLEDIDGGGGVMETFFSVRFRNLFADPENQW